MLYTNNIDDLKIYAEIEYANGFTEVTPMVLFSEPKYTLLTQNFGSKARVLIDARNTDGSELNTTLYIPATAKVVNITGDAGTTYNKLHINVKDRTTKLVINFTNFRYSSAMDAFVCESNIEVEFRISGFLGIFVVGSGRYHGIDITNLIVSKAGDFEVLVVLM